MSWSTVTDHRPSYGVDPDEEGVYPLDEHNVKLLDLVAPLDWKNPTFEGEYDLVAIGAGAGGLVSSKQSARRGYKSALIEKNLAGGDCLNVGCVPSKALLHCAKVFKEIKENNDFLKNGANVEIDFEKIMTRMRKLRAKIAPADSYSGAQKLGVDVYQGKAYFSDPNTIVVGNKTIKFRKAVIATGGRAMIPQNIPPKVKYLTNSNIFNLTELPEKLVMVGGGPINCELGQAFAIFGTKVVLLLRSNRILSNEDEDVSQILENILVHDGIEIIKNVKIKNISTNDNGTHIIQTECGNRIDGSHVFFGTGRTPNVEGLGLEKANVKFNINQGVFIDPFLQTSNPKIYAVGDVVAGKERYTHLSGTHAQMVVDNALFEGKRNADELLVPHVIYTNPEIAKVGETDSSNVDIYKAKFEHCDRAILDGSTTGFVKIFCKKGTDEIIGATIVSKNAGEMISELALAIKFKIGLGNQGLGSIIHSYPTMSDCIGGCIFQYKMKHWKVKL